jgi:hypothetical protein
LQTITIPSSVIQIEVNAFINTGLTTVIIANEQLMGIPSPASGVSFFGANDVQTILPS